MPPGRSVQRGRERRRDLGDVDRANLLRAGADDRNRASAPGAIDDPVDALGAPAPNTSGSRTIIHDPGPRHHRSAAGLESL